MFTTFSYAIRNQKTEEYSTVETYSPLEGDHIGWGMNNDGTPAYWDIIHDDVTVNLRMDDGTVIPVWGDTLRRLYRELTVVFQTEENEVNHD